MDQSQPPSQPQSQPPSQPPSQPGKRPGAPPPPPRRESLILAHEALPSGQTHAGRFTPDELRSVLSLYDIGAVRSARQLPVGNPLAPKAILDTDAGRLLLKRRPPGADPYAVALAHELLLHVSAPGPRRIPTPQLLGVRASANSLAQIGPWIYELMTFIEGQPYRGDIEQTRAGGALLADFAARAATFHPTIDPPAGGFHRSGRVHRDIASARARLGADADRLLGAFTDVHARAGDLADKPGLHDCPTRVIHADWHPGNLVFAQQDITREASPAIVDFEAPALAPILLDAATGLLQFSLAGRFTPTSARLALDTTRAGAFIRGLAQRESQHAGDPRSRPGASLAEAVRRAPGELTALMAEALLVEAIAPIAATGVFGLTPGPIALEAAIQTAEEILEDAGALTRLIATSANPGG